MFISELANIYSKKPYLNNIIPFHEISPQLELFINQEVRLGARNLNPYRFSFKFAHNPKDVINLFIAFSTSNGPLKRLYRYDCNECGETNILDDEQLKNFKCYNCSSNGNLETKNFLEDVRVIFEIKEPYLRDVRTRLKDRASSDKQEGRIKSGEAKQSEVSLKEVFDMNKNDKSPIDNDLLELEAELMHRLSYGLGHI